MLLLSQSKRKEVPDEKGNFKSFKKVTIHFGYERFVSGVCREQFLKLIIYNNKRKLISDF